jgi:hypothetical protein
VLPRIRVNASQSETPPIAVITVTTTSRMASTLAGPRSGRYGDGPHPVGVGCSGAMSSTILPSGDAGGTRRREDPGSGVQQPSSHYAPVSDLQDIPERPAGRRLSGSAGAGMLRRMASLVDRLLPDELWKRIQPLLPPPPPRPPLDDRTYRSLAWRVAAAPDPLRALLAAVLCLGHAGLLGHLLHGAAAAANGDAPEAPQSRPVANRSAMKALAEMEVVPA